jgi:hypothetical protein
MPKARSQKAPKAPRQSGAPKTPVQIAREAADALFRAATECCHQHDRVSRVHAKSDLVDELKGAQHSCDHCDDVLKTLTKAYEEAAADVRPDRNETWWRNANAMWLASREYLRRHGGAEAANRELKEHGPEQLEAIQTEYELEASALLALRHAAEAYKRDRPTAA